MQIEAEHVDALVSLRRSTLSRHPRFRDGPASRRALEAWAGRLVNAASNGGALELRVRNGVVQACFVLARERNAFYSPQITRAHLDCDPTDSDSVEWLLQKLGQHRQLIQADFLAVVDAEQRGLVQGAESQGLHIEALYLLGSTRGSLRHLQAKRDPKDNLDHLGISVAPIAPRDSLDEVVDMYRVEFEARPQYCWYCSHSAYLDELRELLRRAQGSAEPSYLLLRQADRIVGCAGYEISGDDPFFGPSAMLNIVLHERVQGRGVVSTLYLLLLRRLVEAGIEIYRGETAHPAIMRLASQLDRDAFAYELRGGPGHFALSHFGISAR